MPTRPRGRTAAPPKDEGLKLDDAHAIAVLEKAVEYEVIDETEVPDNKRQRMTAAAEQIDLLIEAWTKGGINPDSKEKEKREMGLAIQDILDLAGVEIDGKEVTYGPLPELDDVPADEPEAEADGEAAFDINDVIKGYEELTAVSRIKAIKKLELDMDDDDDYNTAVFIYEWEEAQEKPSGRVLTTLDDMLPQDGEAAAEPEDESAEEAGDGEGEGEEAWEQPWTKATGAPADYEKMSAVDVKKYLDKLLAKDELGADMLQYVMDYEEQRPVATRKRIMDYAAKLMGEVPEGEAPEEEPEEAPARAGRPSAARSLRSSLRGATAKEEEPAASSNGSGIYIVSGGEEDTTVYGLFAVAGTVADLLAEGVTTVTVEAG